MHASFTDATFWVCFMMELERISSEQSMGTAFNFLCMFLWQLSVWFTKRHTVIDLLDKAR